MRGLILKDILNVKNMVKSLLFVFAVFGSVTLLNGDENGIVFILFCSFFGGNMVITAFSYDDASSWDKYARIMPVNTRSIVGSKFVVQLIMSFSSALFALFVSLIVYMVKGMGAGAETYFDFSDIGTLLAGVYLSLVVTMLFNGLAIPLTIKFGAEKGRLLTVISLLFPAVMTGVAIFFVKSFNINTDELPGVAVFSAFLIIAICYYYLMFLLALKLYEKKKG